LVKCLATGGYPDGSRSGGPSLTTLRKKRLQRFKRKTDTLHSRSRVIVLVSQQLRELEVDIKPVCQTHTHAQTDGQAENITPSSVHRLDGEGTKTFER